LRTNTDLDPPVFARFLLPVSSLTCFPQLPFTAFFSLFLPPFSVISNSLDEPTVTEVMRKQKANQKEQVKIPYDKVRAIVNKDLNPKELEDFILKAVADYQKKLMRQQQNRDAR